MREIMKAPLRDILPNLAPSLFLFILPFAHTTVLRYVALALTVVSAVLAWKRQAPPPIPLKLPLVLWLGVAAASLIWATRPGYSADEIRVEVVYSILAFLSFYALTQRKQTLKIYAGAVLASVVTLGVLALGLYARSGSLEGDTLLSGVLYYVAFLLTALPIVLALLVRRESARSTRIGAAVILMLMLSTGLLTLNRSFLPTAAVVCVLFFSLYAKYERIRVRPRVSLVATATLALVVVAAGFVWVAGQRIHLQDNAVELVEKTLQVDPRPHIWEFGVEQIEAHPWTGTGFGRMAQAHKFQRHLGDPQYSHAHNIVLNYGVEMGIPGMIVLIILFGAVVLQFRKLCGSENRDARLIGVAGISLVAAVLLKSMVDDLFVRHLALLFWSLVGMGLGYGNRSVLPAPRSADR